MIVSPADFAAFSEATGAPYPASTAEKAQLLPVILDWKAAQQQQQAENRGHNLLATALVGAGTIGLGAGAYGIYQKLRKQGISEPVAAKIAAKSAPAAPQPLDLPPAAPQPPARVSTQRLTPQQLAAQISISPAETPVSAAPDGAFAADSMIPVRRDKDGKLSYALGALFPGNRKGTAHARGRGEYQLNSLWNDPTWGPLLHAANTPDLQQSLVAQAQEHNSALAGRLQDAINLRNGSASPAAAYVKTEADLPSPRSVPENAAFFVGDSKQLLVPAPGGSGWVDGSALGARARLAASDRAAYGTASASDLDSDGNPVDINAPKGKTNKGMLRQSYLPPDESNNASIFVNEEDLSYYAKKKGAFIDHAGELYSPELSVEEVSRYQRLMDLGLIKEMPNPAAGALFIPGDDASGGNPVRVQFGSSIAKELLNRPIASSDLGAYGKQEQISKGFSDREDSVTKGMYESLPGSSAVNQRRGNSLLSSGEKKWFAGNPLFTLPLDTPSAENNYRPQREYADVSPDGLFVESPRLSTSEIPNSRVYTLQYGDAEKTAAYQQYLGSFQPQSQTDRPLKASAVLAPLSDVEMRIQKIESELRQAFGRDPLPVEVSNAYGIDQNIGGQPGGMPLLSPDAYSRIKERAETRKLLAAQIRHELESTAVAVDRNGNVVSRDQISSLKGSDDAYRKSFPGIKAGYARQAPVLNDAGEVIMDKRPARSADLRYFTEQDFPDAPLYIGKTFSEVAGAEEIPDSDSYIKKDLGTPLRDAAQRLIQISASGVEPPPGTVVSLAREYGVAPDDIEGAAGRFFGGIDLRANSGFTAPHAPAVGGKTHSDWLTQALSAMQVTKPADSHTINSLLASESTVDRATAAQSWLNANQELAQVLSSQMPGTSATERISLVQEALNDAADDYHRAIDWAASNDSELAPRLTPGAKGFPSFDQFARPYVRKHVLGSALELSNAGGGSAPVINLPADVAELIANEAITSGTPVPKLINQRLAGVKSPVEAVWKLDGILANAASQNLDEPYTVGSKLAERFWDAAPADDSSRVGRLKARLGATSESRVVPLYPLSPGDQMRGATPAMPIAVKFGSRFPDPGQGFGSLDQSTRDEVITAAIGAGEHLEPNKVLKNETAIAKGAIKRAAAQFKDGLITESERDAAVNAGKQAIADATGRQDTINSLRLQGEKLISRLNNATRGRGFLIDNNPASGNALIRPDDSLQPASLERLTAASDEDDLPSTVSSSAGGEEADATVRAFNSAVGRMAPGDADRANAELRRQRLNRQADLGLANAATQPPVRLSTPEHAYNTALAHYVRANTLQPTVVNDAVEITEQAKERAMAGAVGDYWDKVVGKKGIRLKADGSLSLNGMQPFVEPSPAGIQARINGLRRRGIL